MTLILWILSGILAAMFLMAGMMKLGTPHGKLIEKMPWAEDFSPATVKLIGAAEILGSLGLILPVALGILSVLAPVAAFALALVMLLAMRPHLRRQEKKEVMTNVFLFLLALAVGILHQV